MKKVLSWICILLLLLELFFIEKMRIETPMLTESRIHKGESVTQTTPAPEAVPAAAVDSWRGDVLDERGAAEYLSTGGADAAVEISGRRCRVNFLSSLNGPALVLRPISAGGELDLAALGLPAEQLEQLCAKTRGMIFIVGGTERGWMPMTAMWWAFLLELVGAALLYKAGVIRVR